MCGPVHVGACASRGNCKDSSSCLMLCMLTFVLFHPACTGVCTLRQLLACQRSSLYRCIMFDLMVMSSYFTEDCSASIKVPSYGTLLQRGAQPVPAPFAHLHVHDNAYRCVHLTNQVAVSLSRLPQLVDLDLSDCNNLGDTGLQSILRGLPLLQNLSLQHCAHITDSGALSCQFTHASNSDTVGMWECLGRLQVQCCL